MSRFSRSTRGASVLAALVLAAFLASIALVVQQGSPIAYTHSQTALGAAPPSAQAAATTPTASSQPSQPQQQKDDCNVAPNLGYDMKLHADGSLEKVPVCTMHNLKSSTAGTKKYPSQPTEQDFGSAAGRCIGTSSTLPSSDWRCVIATCKLQAQSSGRAAYNKEVCQYAYNDQGAASKDSPNAAPLSPSDKQAIAEAAAGGDPAAIQQAKDLLKQDSSFQSTLDSAFQDQAQKLADQSNAADQTIEDLNKIAGLCADPGSSGCNQLAQAEADKAAAQEKLQNLTNNYADLAAAEKKLAPDTCGSAGGCGNPPPNTPCSGPNCATPPFSEPPTNPQTGFGQRPPMGGPSGGGGQPPPPQQQCQPQYFCSNNTVMYAQCYNLQQGNAQQVQQCQQGYSCQNNSCQPQAIYGYCADGRTPRSGPAQQQPPASSCTVGTWQDTSNGCQTSWQCVPNGGNGGTSSSTPTAQLSCQPLSAISGSTVSFSYACAGGATDIAASGFSISPSTLAGNATTTIQKPAGGSSVTYSLSCSNKNVSPAATASAQCTVQVGNASIVLVATPDRVSQSETDTTKKQSTIGWVTSGMQACTIADPDFSDWTSQQAGNTSVSGAATSPVIATTTTFTLTCTTLAGTAASSSVKVLSI